VTARRIALPAGILLIACFLLWRHGNPPAVEATPPEDPLAKLMDGEPAIVVFQLRPLRHTPVGDVVLPCFDLQPGGPLDRLFGEGAIDRFDRLAVTRRGAILTGTGLVATATGARHGEHALVFGSDIGLWKDRVVILARDGDRLRGGLDRLDAPAGTPTPFTADEMQSDVYAVLDGKTLATLPSGIPDLMREGIAKVKEARITSRIGATSHHVVRLEADPDDDSLTQVRRWAIAMAAEVGNQTRVSPTARGAVMSIDTPVAAFERQLASCRFGLGGDPLSVTRSDEPDPAACGRLAAEKGVARRSFGGRSWSRTVDVQANQTTIEYVTCDEKTRWTATASVGGHSWSTVIARRLDASLARKVIP